MEDWLTIRKRKMEIGKIQAYLPNRVRKWNWTSNMIG